MGLDGQDHSKERALVVGLGGSLRHPSRSLSALEIAMDAAQAAGATVRLFDLRILALPFLRTTSGAVSGRTGVRRRRVRGERPDLDKKETVADESQGVPLATMQRLSRYWATEYDWRICEGHERRRFQRLSQ